MNLFLLRFQTSTKLAYFIQSLNISFSHCLRTFYNGNPTRMTQFALLLVCLSVRQYRTQVST